MFKMIPPVPKSAVMMPTPKQKIGFSIESIVGNDAAQQTINQQSSNNNNNQQSSPQQTLIKSDMQQLHQHQTRHDIQDIISRLHSTTQNVQITATNLGKSPEHLSKGAYSPPPPQTRLTPDQAISYKRSRSPPSSPTGNQQTPPQPPSMMMNKGPIMVPGMPPGLIRPFPVAPSNVPDIKTLPPYINSPEMVPAHHNPHLLAAAQFQMAAALQAGHVLGPAGMPPHGAFLGNPAMHRDSYPLYPWLLSRHGRIFPHRFPGNFLLQPFRKPKRIRTAFSPSQLLKLEHAFENNQYVVGAERKALAQSLNLSETQVKVWFQNRRTKHKRMQQEDEKGSSQQSGSSPGKTQSSCEEDEDDELIDMEMDDCPSDDEIDTSH